MSNWLERRRQRELAIAAKGPDLWITLCGVIKESVDGFNEYYAGDRPIACELLQASVKLSKQYAVSDVVRPHLAAQSTTEISLNARGVDAVRTIPRPGSVPKSLVKRWEFSFEADENGTVFFRYGEKLVSPDTVAQEVLEDWLFGK